MRHAMDLCGHDTAHAEFRHKTLMILTARLLDQIDSKSTIRTERHITLLSVHTRADKNATTYKKTPRNGPQWDYVIPRPLTTWIHRRSYKTCLSKTSRLVTTGLHHYHEGSVISVHGFTGNHRLLRYLLKAGLRGHAQSEFRSS